MTIFFIIITIVVICLIGLSKGGLGGTLGALTTPLMTLVLPANQAIGLLLPILIIADIFAVASHWQHWDRKLISFLIPGSVVGMLIASFLLARISPEGLRRGIGIIALLFVIYKLFEKRIANFMQYHPRNWHGVVAGSLAGFGSTLAHTGGPPMTIYLLMQNVSPRTFAATSVLVFALLNLMKVPFYFYNDLFDFGLLGQVIWLLPLLPISVWAGKQWAVKIDKVVFDWIIITFLAFSAVFLLR